MHMIKVKNHTNMQLYINSNESTNQSLYLIWENEVNHAHTYYQTLMETIAHTINYRTSNLKHGP